MIHINEELIEQATLGWLKDLGYTIVFGNDISPRNMIASLRYSLLPKLMRGEVRVKDVSNSY